MAWLISRKAMIMLSLFIVALPAQVTYGQGTESRRSAAAFPQDFQKFWSVFRKALLAGEYDRIASLTRLPLRLTGHFDNSPVRQVGEAGLGKALEAVLASDSGLSLRFISMREFIEKLGPTLRDERGISIVSPDFVEVGLLGFRHMDGQWRLYEANLPADEENIGSPLPRPGSVAR